MLLINCEGVRYDQGKVQSIHRSRMYTCGKGRRCCLGDRIYFQFLVVLATFSPGLFEEYIGWILHIILVNSSFSSYHPGVINPLLHFVLAADLGHEHAAHDAHEGHHEGEDPLPRIPALNNNYLFAKNATAK